MSTNEIGKTGSRSHLVIAGTGRTGTTFLVRYLTAMGLDTHLSRRGADAWLDEQAQAGLEDFPVGSEIANLPYVIKNPMLNEFVDQFLGDARIHLDGAIVPIRSLRDATSSRIILERRAMYQSQPWLAYMDKAWGVNGIVPGGLLYSLQAIDEARVLAMGFHVLLERLVHSDIPIVLLDFPRLIYDGPYLFKKLQPFLPKTASEQLAEEAHRTLAEPAKVRTESEVAATNVPLPDIPTFDDTLDSISLRRELARLNESLASTAARLREAELELSRLRRPSA